MQENNEILKERESAFNLKKGARVGDYLLLPHGEYTRFTHLWEDSIQTGGSSGGQYYFGTGYLSYSGGLDSGVKLKDIEQTEEIKKGWIWFFDRNISGAGRGVNFEIDFKVFKLKEGADLSGLPQIEYHRKKLIRDQAETITRINGNGQPYTLPLPEVHIKANNLWNSVYLEHFEKQICAKLERSAYGYTFQPLTHEQLNTVLLLNSWKTDFHNNSCHRNTLFLTIAEK